MLGGHDHGWRGVDAENRPNPACNQQRVIRPLATADIERQVARVWIQAIENPVEIVVGSFAVPLVRLDASVELFGGAVLVEQIGRVCCTIHGRETEKSARGAVRTKRAMESWVATLSAQVLRSFTGWTTRLDVVMGQVRPNPWPSFAAALGCHERST